MARAVLPCAVCGQFAVEQRESRANRTPTAVTRPYGHTLSEALDRTELFLLYQPKIAVRRRLVAGAEALLRWQHPKYGLLLPDSFIDQAEADGSIAPVAMWTLEQLIADSGRLAAAGYPIRLFMNVSGGMLGDDTFIAAACLRIASTGALIGFEITETAVIKDPDQAIANLRKCADSGIALAIDDYGAGLSSLLYLKQLPASELKIDKAFITQLTSTQRDPLIVRSTIDLAHALGMEVTAEGVETPAALALLTVMGCEMVQGFLLSHPVALGGLIDYLRAFNFEAMNLADTPSVLRPASFWARVQ